MKQSTKSVYFFSFIFQDFEAKMHQPTPTHPPHDTSPPPPASDMKHGRVKELTSNQFVIGTRKSELAMWQTRFVQGELEQRARETFAALERVSNQQLLDKNMNNNNSNNNYNINYNNNNNNSNNSNNSSLFINNETVKDSFATFSLLPMTTTGDDNLVQALAAIGSKALFTKELELALESHQADL